MNRYLEKTECDIQHADFDRNVVIDCDDVYPFINRFNISDGLLGDVNQDNVTDGTDLNLMKEYLVGAVKEVSPMLTPKAMFLMEIKIKQKQTIISLILSICNKKTKQKTRAWLLLMD